MTLRLRQIAAALRGSEELRMDVYGYRAQQTWRNLLKVRPHLDEISLLELNDLMRDGLSRSSVVAVRGFLKELCQRYQTQCRKKGLKAWKLRVRASEREAFRWLKGTGQDVAKVMRLRDGTFTANDEVQLRAIYEAWRPILHKFKDRPPKADQFFDFFGDVMKGQDMKLVRTISRLRGW